MSGPLWSREDRDDPFVRLREVVLERLRVATSYPVARHVIESAAIERRDVLNHLADTLIVGMSSYVLADRLAPEVVRESRTFRFNVPASGWQEWKANHGARWLPAWFMRRWPVRFVEHVMTGEVTVRLERFWTFPEATVQAPELGQPVRLMQWDSRVQWTEGGDRG